MSYLISKNELSAYGASRRPVATYSMGLFGIEILDEVEQALDEPGFLVERLPYEVGEGLE